MKNQLQNSEILSENERKAIQKCVENALISKEKYPVKFNEFWYWLGYFRKQKALTFLRNNFIKNLDFLPDFLPAKTQNGRPQKSINLTLDCAINFAKKSNTAKSNLVYDFILICKENFEKNNQNINLEQNDELKPLINLQQKNGNYMVSAIELYTFLGYGENNWVRWYKVNITENPFALENVDFTSLLLKRSENSKGNFGLDFLITIDFAKKLCMQARTEKGEEARNYFLKCEKDLLEIIQKPVPNISPETTQEIFDKLTRFENRLDTYSLTLVSNLDILFRKMEDIYFNALEKAENFTIALCEKSNKRINLLESRILALENKKPINQLPKAKKTFFLMVIFDQKENYHKIFTKENPVFQVENQIICFEQSEVLFSMEFESKTECKKIEKNILALLKFQNTHIKEDYFELKSHHFQMFEGLKAN